jgi:hypothetical protein
MSLATFSTEGIYVPDNLVANEPALLLSEKGTLLSGQNLKRGALLGRITAGGKLMLSLSASGDGSQNPMAILAEDCDASAGDKECLYYVRGDFNDFAVTFGTGHTAASTKAALRDIGIFIVTGQQGV